MSAEQLNLQPPISETSVLPTDEADQTVLDENTSQVIEPMVAEKRAAWEKIAQNGAKDADPLMVAEWTNVKFQDEAERPEKFRKTTSLRGYARIILTDDDQVRTNLETRNASTASTGSPSHPEASIKPPVAHQKLAKNVATKKPTALRSEPVTPVTKEPGQAAPELQIAITDHLPLAGLVKYGKDGRPRRQDAKFLSRQEFEQIAAHKDQIRKGLPDLIGDIAKVDNLNRVHRSNGQFMSNTEVATVANHQDEIREGFAERTPVDTKPEVRKPDLADLLVKVMGYPEEWAPSLRKNIVKWQAEAAKRPTTFQPITAEALGVAPEAVTAAGEKRRRQFVKKTLVGSQFMADLIVMSIDAYAAQIDRGIYWLVNHIPERGTPEYERTLAGRAEKTTKKVTLKSARGAGRIVGTVDRKIRGAKKPAVEAVDEERRAA